ncbi:MAG: histidine kinase [Zoogloeaceae bacterium]|jgi:two-component system sensor histidine kinase PilS (NtrC family)|nr:histidine kinase [Zoogloeaceae bacterium]
MSARGNWLKHGFSFFVENEKKPQWNSFCIFNAYRLIQAFLIGLMSILPWGDPLISSEYGNIHLAIGVETTYIALTVLSAHLSLSWRKLFYFQVTVQALIDAICISAIMFALGGMKSGLGGLLLVSVAGSSLVTQGRLVLFYAAVSSICILLAEFLSDFMAFTRGNAYMAQSGFLSLGFFATAISAYLLRQRILSNAAIAHQRSIERDDQIEISRQITNRMQDGVLVVNGAGGILNSNPQARDILARADLEGATLADIVPALAHGYQDWRAHLARDMLEFTGVGEREIAARFVPTQASNNAALIFLEDLGKLRETAQQLKLASLGQLTASIAHEIRNPLAAISHASELFMEEADNTPPPPLQTRLIRIVRDNTLRLERIIQDVLVLGRQQTRQSGVATERVFIRSYLEEFARTLQAQEGLEEGVIQTRADEPAELCFNPEQLRQVLWNLVTNALRYASRQPGAVRLEVRSLDKGVELHVLDDGPGIAHELRDQIFDPFFTTSVRGTGLGLHIARELCAANGARLSLGEGPGGHFILLQGKGDALPPARKDAARN